MNWHKEKLGTHCEITSSKRIFYSEYVDSGIPFYRSKEIIELSQGQSISEPLYISQQKYEEIKSIFGVPSPGDMLLTSVGTIGVPYIVTSDERFYFKDGNLTWFRNFDNSLLSKYLYYWICSSDGYGILNNTTIGSSQKALTITSLKKIELPIPPIDVQYRIVDILSAYDSLIENNQKQIKLLEEAAQRLYKEWFVNLRFPGHENVKIIDGVPEGWEKKCINALGKITTGKTPSTSKTEYYGGEYPFIKIPDMHNCIFPLLTESTLTLQGVNSQKNKTIHKNSIMVSCIATVGLVNIATQDCQTNQQINSLELTDTLNLYYMYFTLKRLKDLLEGVGSNGATMTNVNKEKFGKLAVMLPCKHLIEQFYNFCHPIFTSIYQKSVEEIKLKEARDRLLPKLMSGEIEL